MATTLDLRHGPARTAAVVIVLVLVTAGCTGTGQVSTSPSGSAQSPASVPTAGGPAATDSLSSPAATTPAPTEAVPESGTWARLEIGGATPDPREDHTWTVDGEGSTAWLFGGRDGDTSFEDLWAFDLRAESWRLVDVNRDRPAARFGHEAAWVPGLGLVVFGGQRGSTFFNDLWLFEPSGDGVSGSWRLLPPGGGAPVARYGSCSGIGPDGRLWISHGFTSDGARFSDTLAYDFAAEAWSDQAPATGRPVERCLHACWWTSGGQLALYGGQTTGVAALGDMWLFSPGGGGAPTNSWSKAPDQPLAARHLPAIARHASATFLFGGRGLDREALGETWLAVDGGTGFEPFAASGDEPPERSGATLIHSGGDRLLLFGGMGRDASNDLWALTFPGT